MPRPRRLEYAGAFYHVISRGNRQQPIFHKKGDYQRFLETIYTAAGRYHFHLYAYVLMPNHFHLLLEQEDFPLSRLMQVLLTSYARWHNLRYRQIGHLFQGRYRAILCDKESYLLELTRYIHLNPVRARIVKDPKAYPWSSYPAYLRMAAVESLETGLVLGMLGKQKAKACRAYERFVLDAIEEGRRPDFYNCREQIFLGDDRFVEEGKKRYQTTTKVQLGSPVKPPMQKILNAVASIMGTTVPLLVGTTEGDTEKRARELAAGIARGYFGLSLTEVAAAFNRRPNTISVLAKRLAERSQAEAATRNSAEKIIKSIK